MTLNTRLRAGRRPLGTCVSVALAVLGGALVSGSSAHAAPPVGPLAASLTTAEGEYGTIKGRLVWGGPEAPQPKVVEPKGNARKDPAVCAKDAPILDQSVVVDSSTKGIRFAYAYLVKPNGTNPDAAKELTAKTPKVQIDQKNCVFLPHSVALIQDQELELKSSDPVNHNVHLNAFTNESFNLLLPGGGTLTKKLVAEKRPLPLTCDIHPWMKSYIMVFDHPFFAVTGEDGSFEIKGVPAGTQNLVLWQEAVGYVTPGFARGMAVQVSPGKVTDVGEIKLDPTKVKK
jgi:hypothetical protein